MAHQISYRRNTYKAPDTLIPGNSTSSDPVEFDLCPAEGIDLARIKSILVSTAGIAGDTAWSPEVQEAVIKGFTIGAPAFVNTVEAVRGLTIPAVLAKRVGIIQEIPTHVAPGTTQVVPNFEAPIRIVNGLQFSAIAGFESTLAMFVASEITKLSQLTSVDQRLFVQPSGSGGTGMPSGQTGTADSAQTGSEGSATVGSRRTGRKKGPKPVLLKNRPPGTSPNS